MEQTYRSTSLRCTDFVPPHMGMVKAEGGESAVGPFRWLRDERARARWCYKGRAVVVAVAVAIGVEGRE